MVKESKLEKEYNEKYKDVPTEESERMDYIFSKCKITAKKKKQLEQLETYINDIKWKELAYTFYIIPKATPRPRMGKRGIFYVKGANDTKEFFKRFINDTTGEFPIIHTPCTIELKSYLPTPSSMSNTEKVLAEKGLIRPISKPDWDNIAKTYCDMIRGTLIVDDSYILSGTCEKFYSIKPRIEMKIRYMESFDCQYNKKKHYNKRRET